MAWGGYFFFILLHKEIMLIITKQNVSNSIKSIVTHPRFRGKI
nr:MAG TPA: hypothetical protein [Caudoviricetes sp.]